MKKWILLIAALLIIAMICIYVFIPSTITISETITAKTTRDGAYRIIQSKDAWQKWWNYNLPEKASYTKDTAFSYNDYKYSPSQSGNYNTIVSVQGKGKTISSAISLLQFKADSISISWQCNLQTAFNPIERIKQFKQAISLKKDLALLLDRLKTFVEKNENIYGIKIIETTTRDSFLIVQKQIFSQQPSMSDVYELINSLKLYAKKNNCVQTNPPMLNILKEDSNQYRVMVGLPINNIIDVTPPFSFVKMTNGNFMFTRVQGGLKTVQNALDEMQLYFDDYDKTSMAITFQNLVTDRIKESDTTKWITEIYAPVM